MPNFVFSKPKIISFTKMLREKYLDNKTKCPKLLFNITGNAI
jgi:hypothetical protein